MNGQTGNLPELGVWDPLIILFLTLKNFIGLFNSHLNYVASMFLIRFDLNKHIGKISQHSEHTLKGVTGPVEVIIESFEEVLCWAKAKDS